MRILLRYAFMLLAWSYGVMGYAQAPTTTLELNNMTKVADSPMRWIYGGVTCTSANAVTSITLSMVNNQLVGNSSPITTPHVFNSLGNNPRTITYVFSPALTQANVEIFIKGMTFQQTAEIAGVNPWVDITIDANPTKLPAGSTITVWRDHPDGTPHYYVWVASASIHYSVAYNAAKSYYFQGMRGYLPTITSSEESEKLTNISPMQGWSGGVRTIDGIADNLTIANPNPAVTGNGANYRWICGPETGFFYYKGPTYNTSGAGPMNGAFSGFNPTEPNNAGNENCMQVNHANLKWNDYAPTQAAIQGYFIEFGGTGKAYSVGAATYPVNTAYYVPTVATTNNQWYGFSPGNRASTSTTFKPNSMRARAMVIE